MNNPLKEILPLYIIQQATESPTSIGVIYPSFKEAELLSGTVSDILEKLKIKKTEVKDQYMHLIKVGQTQIYFLALSEEYIRGKRLNHYIFVNHKDMNSDIKDSILSGLACMTDKETLYSISSDMLIVMRKDA